MAWLVAVTGPPAVGKSSLARRLFGPIGLSGLTQDLVEESLYDALAPGRLEAGELAAAARGVLLAFAEQELAVGRSLWLELDLEPESLAKALTALAGRVDFSWLEIQCVCEGNVLARRFQARMSGGARHAAHPDAVTLATRGHELRRGRYEPVVYGGKRFEVDTTQPDAVDFAGLSARVQELLAGG